MCEKGKLLTPLSMQNVVTVAINLRPQTEIHSQQSLEMLRKKYTLFPVA